MNTLTAIRICLVLLLLLGLGITTMGYFIVPALQDSLGWDPVAAYHREMDAREAAGTLPPADEPSFPIAWDMYNQAVRAGFVTYGAAIVVVSCVGLWFTRMPLQRTL